MKYIHVLLFSFLTFSIFSQEPFVVKKSKAFFEGKKNISHDFTIKDGNGGYILIRPLYTGTDDRLKNYFIEHYDKDLNLIKHLEYGDKKTNILGAFVNEDKLHLIEDLSDLKAVPNKVIKVVVKIGSLKQFDFAEKELLDIDLKERYGHIIDFFDNDKGWFLRRKFLKFVFSETKESFALSFHVKIKELEYHNVYTFDNSLTQLYTNEIVLESRKQSFEYDNMIIDEEGQSTYLMGRHYPELGAKTSQGKKLYFEVYKLNGKDKKSIQLPIKNGYVTKLFPKIINDKLYLANCYQNIDDKKQKGLTFFEVDKNQLKINRDFFIPISHDILNKNFKINLINKSMLAFDDNVFRKTDLFVTKNNDFLLVAEETRYIYGTSYPGNIRHQPPSSVYHGAILTVGFTNHGNLKDAALIDKNQYAQYNAMHYNSMLSFYKNDKIHYLFNYKKKKKEKKEAKRNM